MTTINSNNNVEDPSCYRPMEEGRASVIRADMHHKEADVVPRSRFLATRRSSLDESIRGHGVVERLGGSLYVETPIPESEKFYDWVHDRYFQSAILHLAPNVVLDVPAGMRCRHRYYNDSKSNESVMIEHRWRDVPGNQSSDVPCLIVCWLISASWAIATANPVGFMFMCACTALLCCIVPLWFSTKQIEITPSQEIKVQERVFGKCRSTTVFDVADIEEIICQRRVFWKNAGGSTERSQIAFRYEVLVNLRDDDCQKFLMVGLETAEMALFIQQEIQRMMKRNVVGGFEVQAVTNTDSWEISELSSL